MKIKMFAALGLLILFMAESAVAVPSPSSTPVKSPSSYPSAYPSSNPTSSTPYSSPQASAAASGEKLISMNEGDDLVALAQDLRFEANRGGEQFLMQLLERMLKFEPGVISYVFKFVSNHSSFPPTGYGISYQGWKLQEVIQSSPHCLSQATLQSGTHAGSGFPLTQSLVEGACGLMTVYRSTFTQLQLKPPAGMSVKTPEGNMNPKVSERMLEQSGYVPDAKPGLDPKEMKKMYENYADDPEFSVECEDKYTVLQDKSIQDQEAAIDKSNNIPPEATKQEAENRRKKQCEELQQKLDEGQDCDMFFVLQDEKGKEFYHAERATGSEWHEPDNDPRNDQDNDPGNDDGCCSMKTEDAMKQGQGTNFPYSGAENSSSACRDQKFTSPLDKKVGGTVHDFRVICCKKVPKTS